MQKKNKENVSWGNFYKTVFALVLPMALQNLINVGVTAADVVMLGKVGEKEIEIRLRRFWRWELRLLFV